MHDREPSNPMLKAGLSASALSVAWTVATGGAAIAIGLYGGSTVLAAFGAIGLVDAVGSAALIGHFRHAVQHEAVSESKERLTSLIVAAGMAAVGAATAGESIHRLLTAGQTVSLPQGVALAVVSALF